MSTSPDSYYGQPVIKEPVWTWQIPVYLFTGGLGGAGAGLAVLSERRGNDLLARRVWATALAAHALSPILLSSDLGKPLRAANMFRMFKVTSPMSVGSWNLLLSGAATGVSATNAWLGACPRLSRVGRPAAALLGLPLSTYTGALIANTAIPVWHEARRLLPFLFGSGAALSAGAFAVLATPPEQAAPARRLALMGAALEGSLMELMPRHLGEHGEVYSQGLPGKLTNVSRACLAGGTALLAVRGGRSRAASIAAGALLNAAALATRWAVFRAGFVSARDPKYVVGPQRQAIERGRRRGASRRNSRVAEPDPRLASPAGSM